MSDVYLPINEYTDYQWIRLVDIFLLGPYLVWFGLSAEKLNKALRLFCFGSGVVATVNNGINYLRIEEATKTATPETKLYLDKYANSQLERLGVIFFTSPGMIAAGLLAKKPLWQRLPLILLGLYQIYMHTKNYFKYASLAQ